MTLPLASCGSGDTVEGAPDGRTAAEVCRIWRDGHVENDKAPWTAGSDKCDPGVFSESGLDDTLRRINMFRELSGLPPVTEDKPQRVQQQACAVLMHANQALSHDPPPSWACWTKAAADGASSSNLAIGWRMPGAAIDGLMADVGVSSVGHRRWLLGFFLGKVGLGFAGDATCVRVFDETGVTDRPWTAFPPAGPAPIAMLEGFGRVPWSFQAADGIEGAQVSMRLAKDGSEIPVESWIPDVGYRIPDAIVWQPPRVSAGDKYRITVTRPAKDPVTYDVELVDCSSAP
ncbi:hypothetical protein AKJ08_3599 [Vulgatibacter incomptus]|uniref:SCP domain-containing protein n=1 Tax=Vulgatibacter incomptus TaxID=1391653 RepID=A0A0K1PI84_9BACT|nr:hypothetical protein AKJ08_3599 [Vulgatibacter incomptus]